MSTIMAPGVPGYYVTREHHQDGGRWYGISYRTASGALNPAGDVLVLAASVITTDAAGKVLALDTPAHRSRMNAVTRFLASLPASG